jgi:hypothetical protein
VLDISEFFFFSPPLVGCFIAKTWLRICDSYMSLKEIREKNKLKISLKQHPFMSNDVDIVKWLHCRYYSSQQDPSSLSFVANKIPNLHYLSVKHHLRLV